MGAGPYGLSVAAHLRDRGLSVAVFGRPLAMWRDHMPAGMRLRSHWWATNLSDPLGQFALDRFFTASRLDRSYPVPIETFAVTAQWDEGRDILEVWASIQMPKYP